MTIIGSYEAKTHFSQLIERVIHGERIVITRHNVPVATLEAVEPTASASPEQVIAQMKSFRRGYRLGGLSITAMKDEGRE